MPATHPTATQASPLHPHLAHIFSKRSRSAMGMTVASNSHISPLATSRSPFSVLCPSQTDSILKLELDGSAMDLEAL